MADKFTPFEISLHKILKIGHFVENRFPCLMALFHGGNENLINALCLQNLALGELAWGGTNTELNQIHGCVEKIIGDGQ